MKIGVLTSNEAGRKDQPGNANIEKNAIRDGSQQGTIWKCKCYGHKS